MLNAAVIGMGVGQKHALAYKNHESCKLKSICDFDKNKIFELKKQFPDTDIFFFR